MNLKNELTNMGYGYSKFGFLHRIVTAGVKWTWLSHFWTVAVFLMQILHPSCMCYCDSNHYQRCPTGGANSIKESDTQDGTRRRPVKWKTEFYTDKYNTSYSSHRVSNRSRDDRLRIHMIRSEMLADACQHSPHYDGGGLGMHLLAILRCIVQELCHLPTSNPRLLSLPN